MSAERELLEACVEAVRRGGAVLAERWGRPRTIDRKSSSIDLVTDADRASEAAILGFLATAFPEAAILAEETGGRAGRGPLRFHVDPLDGTVNYAHGLPIFSSTVAVEDGAGLVAGAVLDPLRGELFTALRGGGAWLGDQRLRASSCERLGDALLVTGFPYDVHTTGASTLRLFSAFTLQAQGIRRLGSAALDLAYVAAGRLDGFWEEALKPWDMAAGVLLAREAGAVATDLEGGDAILERGSVIAAAPGIHAAMRAVVDEHRRS